MLEVGNYGVGVEFPNLLYADYTGATNKASTFHSAWFLIASFSLFGVCPFCEYGNNSSCCHASTVSDTSLLIIIDKFASDVAFEMTIMQKNLNFRSDSSGRYFIVCKLALKWLDDRNYCQIKRHLFKLYRDLVVVHVYMRLRVWEVNIILTIRIVIA